jgi:riboflavin synthase
VFTGIVTDIGTVRAAEPAGGGGGLDLTIETGYRGLSLGESIAVSGACLTVSSKGRGWFGVQAVATTLQRTRFDEIRPGDRVNLERAVQAGDRLGGHLVQGHVDGVGEVVETGESEDALLLDIRVPEVVNDLCIPLGSITVEGVSLTVNARIGQDIIRVAIVPYTRQHTTLGEAAPGDPVHLEGDLMGKYLRAFVERGVTPKG